jgi:hypothetical protein
MSVCEEKLRLTEQYQTANAAFSGAVQMLVRNMGTVSREEHERLRRNSEQMRLESEAGRLNLMRHIEQHGC